MAAGEDIAVFAARLLNEALTTPKVDELLAPFRKQVEASGMTDAELDGFYQGLREDVWHVKHENRNDSQ